MAHVTGGGLAANLARVLPGRVCAVVDRGTWTPPPVFDARRRVGGVEQAELEATLNMGVGMVAVVAPAPTPTAVHIPADALDAATQAVDGGNLRELADRLEQQGVPRLEANSLVRMCEGMWCRGQLGATAHFGGPGRRAPWVIGFHATDAGWFMQLRRDGTVSMCPSDASGLLRHWLTLVDHVRPVT
jgi:hypothetical protein